MTAYNEDAAYKAGRKFVDILARIILLPFALVFAALWIMFVAMWLSVNLILWLCGREVEFKRNGSVIASLKWFKLTRY